MVQRLLPEGWSDCVLADIAEINPGKLEAEKNLKAGFVPMSHAPINYIGKLVFEEKPWGDISKSYTNFKNNDVIFAKVTPCFENGKAAVVQNIPNGIGAGSSEFYVLRRRNKDIPANYLLGIIKTKRFMQEGAENMTGAVGLRRVPRAFVESFPLSLPPLAEQKIIAEKLDNLLSRVESIKNRLENIPALLKKFRQSVLSAAVNGRLTDDWRRGKNLVPDFKKIIFETLLTELRNGISQKPNEEKLGYPILRISSVRSGTIDQDDIRHLECSKTELSRLRLRTGDLLFTRYNGSLEFVGVCGLLKDLKYSNLIYPDKLIRARLNDEALPKYIEIFFSSPTARDAITNCVKTTSGQKGISGKDIKSQIVYLPPLEEQSEIVRRTEQLFAFADSVETQVNNALTRVNNLTQSILAKAFRGELSAQWRADNPDLISGINSAEALLEKISAEKLAELSGTKRGRMRTN